MRYRTCSILVLSLLASACKPTPQVAQAVQPNNSLGATEIAAGTKPAKADVAVEGSTETTQFIPQGASKLATAEGDINADGLQDVVLLVEHLATGEEKLGEGSPRSLLLLTRDASGALSKAAQNDKLVPCAKCGGAAGDPFGYVRAQLGAFTVVIEGGSREHWSGEYTFRFNEDEQKWWPEKVRREVVDTTTSEGKIIEWMEKDLRASDFSSFDPAALPSVDIR